MVTILRQIKNFPSNRLIITFGKKNCGRIQKSKMDKSTTESNTIVIKILEDLLNELPIENQENGDLDH